MVMTRKLNQGQIISNYKSKVISTIANRALEYLDVSQEAGAYACLQLIITLEEADGR